MDKQKELFNLNNKWNQLRNDEKFRYRLEYDAREELKDIAWKLIRFHVKNFDFH